MLTPTTDSRHNRSKPYAQGGIPLALAVQLLPTPIANDAANPAASPSRLRQARAPGLTAEITNRLQPDKPAAPTAEWGGYLLRAVFESVYSTIVGAGLAPAPTRSTLSTGLETAVVPDIPQLFFQFIADYEAGRVTSTTEAGHP
ncbi:hypothetical protein GCM10022408_11630 [Hymenobacter fastidiosus]|uniref:Uncharacterized protein n=1 Tax=Hymenobacter fastidiosus TaxID=486264 RepID=A0ABP7RTR9_9BACT